MTTQQSSPIADDGGESDQAGRLHALADEQPDAALHESECELQPPGGCDQAAGLCQCTVWRATINEPGAGNYAEFFGFFNLGDQPVTLRASWQQLGLEGKKHLAQRLMPFALEQASEAGARLILLHVIATLAAFRADAAGMPYYDPAGALDFAAKTSLILGALWRAVGILPATPSSARGIPQGKLWP